MYLALFSAQHLRALIFQLLQSLNGRILMRIGAQHFHLLRDCSLGVLSSSHVPPLRFHYHDKNNPSIIFNSWRRHWNILIRLACATFKYICLRVIPFHIRVPCKLEVCWKRVNFILSLFLARLHFFRVRIFTKKESLPSIILMAIMLLLSLKNVSCFSVTLSSKSFERSSWLSFLEICWQSSQRLPCSTAWRYCPIWNNRRILFLLSACPSTASIKEVTAFSGRFYVMPVLSLQLSPGWEAILHLYVAVRWFVLKWNDWGQKTVYSWIRIFFTQLYGRWNFEGYFYIRSKYLAFN